MREECICSETCHSHSLLFQGTFCIFLPLLSYPHLFFVKLLPALQSSGLFTEIINKDIENKNRHGTLGLLCSFDFTIPQTESNVEARRFSLEGLSSYFCFSCPTWPWNPILQSTAQETSSPPGSSPCPPPHTKPSRPPSSDLKLNCSRKPHPDNYPIIQWLWESFQKKLNTVLLKKYKKNPKPQNNSRFWLSSGCSSARSASFFCNSSWTSFNFSLWMKSWAKD